MKKLFIILSLVVFTLSTSALTQDSPAIIEAPTVNMDDVKSQDAILAALYDVISGPAGEKRDWDRMRSLFLPEAKLIPADFNGYRSWSIEEYISTAGKSLEKNGFFEIEISRETVEFGAVTHAFSTYESRHLATDEKPFSRGINSIQLYTNGERWWVVNVFWQSERDTLMIPSNYLK